MVTMMLFGNAKECDIATRMIEEAIENREQKQKQREREYERKREQKNRDRQMYHLRHTHDYETLGIPIGKPASFPVLGMGLQGRFRRDASRMILPWEKLGWRSWSASLFPLHGSGSPSV